jgi:hypothetical protein
MKRPTLLAICYAAVWERTMIISIRPINLNKIFKLATNLLFVFVITVAIPSESVACHKNEIPHGKNTECGDDPSPPSDDGTQLYGLVISGDMVGIGKDWELLGSRTIDYKEFFAAPAFGELVLDYFRNSSGPFLGDGPKCFVHPDHPKLFAANLGKSKGNLAAATFWFWGDTDDGVTEVLYRAGLKGTFGVTGDWPPADGIVKTLTLTEWRIAVENEGKDIKSISCLDEGTFTAGVVINVVDTP